MAPLTGKQVFIGVAAAFGVIIGVNLVLAVQAVRTFPGLEVANSYVASQEFDRKRAVQLALGWDIAASYDNGMLRIAITDGDGRPVHAASVLATVGWATSTHDDINPAFAWDGDAFIAPAKLEPGNWNIRLIAVAEDGTEFRQRIPLYIRDERN
ncbi:FixH family protein [Qingshengfaniella alkalisoli]|uniref:FixH family protein n=1 Tax=Qingshengfaniella alkalisoli TaxID=2599296 RepID=A0A5B8JAM2_9RHOB|nr:FixH family protein [Qingshengfaniella alkalisoli]QDY71220.1 FixH family protein [Qingshengfaniella alkalisoli]